MRDRELIRHLGKQHPGSLITKSGEPAMDFASLERINRKVWDAYHAYLHKSEVGHTHDTSGNVPPRGRHSVENPEASGEDMTTNKKPWVQRTGCTCLDPPTHSDDCPGKRGVLLLGPQHGASIAETLWEEMDRLMEGLMTGTDAEDGGDKHRAQGLAYALAVFLNPYAPNIEEIRAQAVARWKEQQGE